jgi:hypothetical protein
MSWRWCVIAWPRSMLQQLTLDLPLPIPTSYTFVRQLLQQRRLPEAPYLGYANPTSLLRITGLQARLLAFAVTPSC